MTSRPIGRALLALAVLTLAVVPSMTFASPVASWIAHVGADVHGTVTDSVNGNPISASQVRAMRGAEVVASTLSDAFGRYTLHNLDAGQYTIMVRSVGYRQYTAVVAVGTEPVALSARLVVAASTLSAISIVAETPLAVDTRTGDQTFAQDQYHGSPTTTTSQIIQQSVAGAARAPSGEVHIRGQHAEYTYYVDGVPVPSGVSGSLNELFDPAIVDKINFQTGGWDAEYGNKNAAIVNVATRVPPGKFHMTASGFGGSFAASGQALSASTSNDQFGLFASLSRQVTDMRRESVSFDTVTFRPYNFHNHGEDLFGFAKMQWNASANDVVTLNGNWSRTTFQVPYDSSGGAQADDRQTDVNTFVNLGWHHLVQGGSGSARPDAARSDLFVGAFYRYGSLAYVPGATDDPQFQFFPDTVNSYNINENRNFTTTGLKLDYTWRPGADVEFKAGTLAQFTTGQENFQTFTAARVAGPTSASALSGRDVGEYVQLAYSPVESFEIRTGARYDSHVAPFAGTQSQFSPRIRLNFFPNPENTVFVYYGRLFLPTNVEDLRAVTSVAQQGVVAAPTLPERDDFIELGYIHRFPHGIVTKLSAYQKHSTPGIDDNTVPGSAIVTSVNIADVRITGVEAVLEVKPQGAWSGYLNLGLNHAYGRGPITGGFFPAETPTGYFDLDHDQRLSVAAGLNWSLGAMYASLTTVYGSGLTNGVDPDTCGCRYGTGLLDFNSGIKVPPSTISNVSAGYSFLFGGTLVRPELFVENVLDQRYLLKGAFFSGAVVGRPRSLQLRVSVGV